MSDSDLNRPPYFDCAATTPVDQRVAELVLHYMTVEFGNAGSRTHEYGSRAREAVEKARAQVADVVDAKPEEVIFTSGATESDNIALLGLETFGRESDRKHIVSTAIEHKAVLEPLEVLEHRGFEVELLSPTSGGWVDAGTVADAVRPDTLVVSVMHVNNETGVLQPIAEIADALGESTTYFHVDAAQGFTKELDQLRHQRIDLISISGHKIFAPKGVGALVTRRRNRKRPPLTPLQYGGGQERGLRPGTIPVPLVAGLGLAAELGATESASRSEQCARIRDRVLSALHASAPIEIHGDPQRALPHIVNLSLGELDSEAAMLLLSEVLAISNGSACTSAEYSPSHVLRAMEIPEDRLQGALRLSWNSATPDPDYTLLANALHRFAG